jgi:hypothetical protein
MREEEEAECWFALTVLTKTSLERWTAMFVDCLVLNYTIPFCIDLNMIDCVSCMIEKIISRFPSPLPFAPPGSDRIGFQSIESDGSYYSSISFASTKLRQLIV